MGRSTVRTDPALHSRRRSAIRSGFRACSAFKSVFDCIKAFSENDHMQDLKRIDVPTLILHGNDEQIGVAQFEMFLRYLWTAVTRVAVR